jgi:DNA polymerase
MTARYIVLDFESYYTMEYSLRRMTPPEYVLHPLFRSFGASLIIGDGGTPVYLEHDMLQRYINMCKERGLPIAFVSHNALFDMCVLHWRYGYKPALMIDTMGMARTLLGHVLRSVSLDSVAKYLGLPAKGKFLAQTMGMTPEQMKEQGLWPKFVEYANHDAWLCQQIFIKLRDKLPMIEFKVMHSVIDCAVTPRFEIDTMVLAEHKHNLEIEKAQLLADCGMSDRSELMSNDKFADALRRLGVEPEMKVSLKTGKDAYAFAKSDAFMVGLDDHYDSKVQALVSARVGHKSTLEETRTQRFINIANIDASVSAPGCYPQGSFPIPLRYGAAHTHRLGGDWKLNTQNMPRQFKRPGQPDKPGRLRTSLRAPKGYKVVTVDAAQIEARINAYVSGQWDLVEAFRQKRDIYSEFAGSSIYNRTITKSDKSERFCGKTAILGLGFQMGPPKFQTTVRVQSRGQLGRELIIPEPECVRIVAAYRSTYFAIAGSWKLLRDHIPALAGWDSGIQFGPVTLRHQMIEGPVGPDGRSLKLHYHNLQKTLIDNQWKWMFTYAEKPKSLYGGLMLENIVQFLARIHIMEVGERVRQITRIGYAAQIHDELVHVVPETEVDALSVILGQEMVRPPSFMPNIPLSFDIGVGDNYGEAK